MRFLARALFWLAASAGLLLAGFALLAALLLIPSIASRGELPGDVQRQALGLVYSTIATQALLPELVLAFASWLVLARIVRSPLRSRPDASHLRATTVW